MALFVEVARTGSFSVAGRNLTVPTATLSRRIAAMEREFGVRLFDRTTRNVALTEAGRRYFERCGHLVDEARLAQEALRDVATRPSGHVRLSMPVDLGVYLVGPLLPDFARQYPGISFDLDLSPHRVDLVGEHVDMALRIGEIDNDKLIARRLGSIQQALFAAPAYLDLHGRPLQPGDLVEHECLLSRGKPPNSWQLQSASANMEVAVRGRFILNSVGLKRVLAERGMGIAALMPWLVRDAVRDGSLEQVLPDWSLPRLPLHALLSSRLQPSCVRVFLDFLCARLAVE